MAGLETLGTIIHIIGSVFLILVVLLQSGKGGGMGATFGGGGGGGAVFGGRGAGGFLAKMTTGLAITFMVTSMALSWISSQQRSVVKPAAPVEGEAAGAGAVDGDAEDAAGEAEASSTDSTETDAAATTDAEGADAAADAPTEDPPAADGEAPAEQPTE